MLHAEFLQPGSQRWTELLDSIPHDFYHLPGYQDFVTRHQEPGQAWGFAATEGEERLFVPVIVRPLPALGDHATDTASDATSARGYPGPVFASGSGAVSESFASRAVSALVKGLRDRGVVTAMLRLHPILLPPPGVLERYGAVLDHGRSVSIDLTLSAEALWQQTRQNHRRDILRSARAGYAVRIDDSWETLGAFVDLYHQSMVRLGAADFWRLPLEYFEHLRDTLGHRLSLCVAEVAGEVAAGALLVEEDGLVEYHLAGTADTHIAASPSKGIVDFAARWAKARGDHTFHLAGSLRMGDTLNHFKVGFSPRQHPVQTWRIVVDPEAYAQLRGAWSRLHGGASPLLDGFFPAYRQP